VRSDKDWVIAPSRSGVQCADRDAADRGARRPLAPHSPGTIPFSHPQASGARMARRPKGHAPRAKTSQHARFPPRQSDTASLLMRSANAKWSGSPSLSPLGFRSPHGRRGMTMRREKATPANSQVPPTLAGLAPVNHGSLCASRAGTLRTFYESDRQGRAPPQPIAAQFWHWRSAPRYLGCCPADCSTRSSSFLKGSRILRLDSCKQWVAKLRTMVLSETRPWGRPDAFSGSAGRPMVRRCLGLGRAKRFMRLLPAPGSWIRS